MIIDFIQYSLYSVIFFLGIAGVGLLIIDILGLKKENLPFSLSISYFLSLCLFVLFGVFGLFLFDDKLWFLRFFTVGYFVVSVAVFFWKRELLSSFLSKKKALLLFGSVLIGSMLLFFFQIYHTSILDEWLHRPIVKSFVQSGLFPLANPINADQSFIYTYHYGAHVVSAALETVFHLGISESLDLFKMANFFAALIFFYGLLRKWMVSRTWALLSTTSIIFLGSSFFLMDTFTTSHLKKIAFLGADWPSNAPLSFGLSGITSIGALLGLVFFFVVTTLLENWKNIRVGACIVIGILFSGFMLFGEYYAVLLLVYAFFLSLFLLFKKKITAGVLLRSFAIVFFVFVLSVYYSGGLGGSMLRSVSDRIDSYVETVFFDKKSVNVSNQVFDKSSEIPLDVVQSVLSTAVENKPLFALKGFSDLGYPSEKRTISFFGKPSYYLRSFFLEGWIIVLIGILFFRKKITFDFSDGALLIFSSVLIWSPFFITTTFGDLNLSKSLAVGLALLHLYFIKVLFDLRVSYKKYIIGFFATLFIFGSLPGMALGSNIQWRWISSKGKEQYCSQNPLCYKGDLTDVLKEFDGKQPGLKRIVSDSKNVRKVADLTKAYVYIYEDNDIDTLISQFGTIYVVRTPELDKVLLQEDKEMIDRGIGVFERGVFRVVSLDKP
jgi:hypothetical protein